MENQGVGVLNTIASSTKNDILLLMIIVAIVAIILAVPLYKAIAKVKAENRKQELDREALILDVVKGNSAVMSELKTLLKGNNENCAQCKIEQLACFQRLEDKQEHTTTVLNEIRQEILRPTTT